MKSFRSAVLGESKKNTPQTPITQRVALWYMVFALQASIRHYAVKRMRGRSIVSLAAFVDACICGLFAAYTYSVLYIGGRYLALRPCSRAQSVIKLMVVVVLVGINLWLFHVLVVY